MIDAFTFLAALFWLPMWLREVLARSERNHMIRAHLAAAIAGAWIGLLVHALKRIAGAA